MERLTNEAIKVDASVDGMIGSFVDLANMKPKLLDVILNGPTLISVSKNVLRSIIRQLYSALAAYEDTGLEPEKLSQCKGSTLAVWKWQNCTAHSWNSKNIKKLTRTVGWWCCRARREIRCIRYLVQRL